MREEYEKIVRPIHLKPFFGEAAEIGSCDSYSLNDPSIFQTFKTA